MKDEFRLINSPKRDEHLSTSDMLINTPRDNPLLFDTTFSFADTIYNPNKASHDFEFQLWTTLLYGAVYGNSEAIKELQNVFNVSSQFLMTIKKIKLSEKKILRLCEHLMLSFTVPSLIQKQLVRVVTNQLGYTTNHFTEDSQSEMWLRYLSIVKDLKDILNLTEIKTGLNSKFIEILNNNNLTDVVILVAKTTPFRLKLRCSEDLVLNILTSSKDLRTEDLLTLKTNQLLSGYESDYEAINTKIKE